MIIKILSLKAFDNGNLISIKVEISNGEHTECRDLIILAKQYADLRLTKGEIDEKQFDEIVYLSNICSAYKKGLFLLGYGACSEKNLIYKLKTKGFEEEYSKIAASMLSEHGYINENDDAMREVDKCLSKLWGKRRIISHLYSKGFTNEAIQNAVEYINGIDFIENCERLIRKDHARQLDDATKDVNAYRKLCASLSRMGYSFSEIKEASLRFVSK